MTEECEHPTLRLGRIEIGEFCLLLEDNTDLLLEDDTDLPLEDNTGLLLEA